MAAVMSRDVEPMKLAEDLNELAHQRRKRKGSYSKRKSAEGLENRPGIADVLEERLLVVFAESATLRWTRRIPFLGPGLVSRH